jgi:hypothetical protein
MIYLSLILVFLSGCFYGTMYTLQFHYDESIFWKHDDSFFDPSVSWANKYSNPSLLIPKFWGSTTIFVFLTDGFHLFQFLFLNTLFAGVILYKPVCNAGTDLVTFIVNFLILRLMFGIGFVLFFNYLLIAKRK